FMVHERVALGGVGGGEGGFHGKRKAHGVVCAWEALARRTQIIIAKDVVAVGEADVRERILRIDRDRPFEALEALDEGALDPLVPAVAGLHVERVSPDELGGAFAKRLPTTQCPVVDTSADNSTVPLLYSA